MARPRKRQKLNNAKSEVIAENVLKENPEGFASTEDFVNDKIVVANHIPEYRKVIFINGRDPGYPLDFHYASATHPLKIYKLIHGAECDLPVEVIDHLEDRNEPQYSYRRGSEGHPERHVVSRKYIFQFRNASKKSA